ncbi:MULTISPECIES: type IV pilin-like G/H family protein [unclassified Anabaena]|uniref:type IV pilin-like G/H family protein n=1 Tax=unclassified Anabaena TaxID=2619674 RepID=UPI0039C72236
MKTELKAKFLQHILNKKKDEQGFTLIELLVVIIIIGILSAIALPSFLNQANKARASEAKTYAGSVNRAQQAYLLENPTFVTAQSNFTLLGLGIKTQTENYTYTLGTFLTNGATVSAVPTTPSTSPAILKGYGGFVTVGITAAGGTGEATTIAALCETNDPIVTGTALDAASAVGAAPNITNLNCATTQKAVK